MPLFYKCPCGSIYREDSAHGSTCPESKHPKDPIAKKEEIKKSKDIKSRVQEALDVQT